MLTCKYTNDPDFRCLEDIRETSAELSLIHFGRENCKPYHVFAGERAEYIIHFIISGQGFYTADRNTRNLSAGQMFLIRPGSPVVYCADSRVPWSYVWFGFKGERVVSLLAQCGFSRNRLILPFPRLEVILSLLNEMFEHISLSPADMLFREASLLRLFSLLAANAAVLPQLPSTDSQGGSGNAYVAQAVDFIYTNYMHSICISDIAEKIGISRTYLNRLFKFEYNMSAQEFLMNFRMHKAAFFLVHTDKPVKVVSRDAGYQDPLVFSKAFKKHYDMSPKSYRLSRQELELRDERPPE